MAREICKNETYAFYLMKLNELNEEHYFNEIAPKYTHMCKEVVFWSHESFVGLGFLDL